MYLLGKQRAPDGSIVTWLLSTDNPTELIECWIEATVDAGFDTADEQTRHLSITQPAPPEIVDEIKASIISSDVLNNWMHLKHIQSFEELPS